MTLQVIRGGVIVQSVALAQHTATMHVGSAARAAADGVASLDGSALLPLAQIPATLTGKDADTVDGQHHSDISSEIDGDISTHAALDQNVHGAGAAETLLHSGDKDIANGIPGLDANSELDILQLRPSCEKYNNHLGCTDNFTETATSGNGAASEDATNHEMDISGGVTVTGHARYQSKKTWTLSDGVFVCNFIIQNLVTGTIPKFYSFIGLKENLASYESYNTVAFMINHQGNSFAVAGNAGGYNETAISPLQNGDKLTIVIRNGIYIKYFVNGTLVATITNRWPSVGMHFGGAVIGYSAGAGASRTMSIDYMDLALYI